MTQADIIFHARLRLPLPSESPGKYIIIPVRKEYLGEFYGYESTTKCESTTKGKFIQVEFEREYISNICVGWKFKSIIS